MNETTSTRPKVQKTDAEWRKQLTPEQYYVTRQHGTERAGTSPLLKEKRDGMFKCVACGAPLFPSDTKYEVGHRLAELLCPGLEGRGQRT